MIGWCARSFIITLGTESAVYLDKVDIAEPGKIGSIGNTADRFGDVPHASLYGRKSSTRSCL
jgi:hypothetical protein